MIKLRDYQNEAISSIFQYYVEGKDGNIIIALPTGTGKSLVLGEFCRLVLNYWPNQRIIALTHVRELIAQNAKAIRSVWPHAPLGIYSAGLNSRDTLSPIIYGGVASVIKCVEKFGHRDLLIIDECHLLSPDNGTMYQRIISELRKLNPHMKVIGLTATRFRLGQGLLTQDGLFNDCPFDLCNIEGFHRLIVEGYISPPIPKQTRTTLDVSGVSIAKGEYVQSELQRAIDRPTVNHAAVTEICEQGQDRKSWLIFCSGIEHAEHCAELLQQFGVTAEAVHSKITADERDKRITAFKDGRLHALTNNNILTTGFDHPPIDLIGMLRPTVSASLWVQMLGRGTRPSPETDKQNCLVLDFAGNTKRLGPIDDPMIPRPKGEGGGDAPVKICDNCGVYNHTRVKFCISCGFEFVFQQKIVRTADTEQLLTGGMPQVETFNVNRIFYNRHVGKKSGRASIKIMYQCGLHRFNDFISFDMDGFPRHKANDFWRQRFTGEPPPTTDLALTCISQARVPKKIRVWVNQQFPKVIGYEW